jgi:hypothetical protein
VFNDLSLHSVVIDEAKRTALRRIQEKEEQQPQQPTVDVAHTGGSALGIDGTPQLQQSLHSPIPSRLRALCAVLLQRPSLPSSEAAAPSASNDGDGGGMADSEIIRSHMTDGPRMG